MSPITYTLSGFSVEFPHGIERSAHNILRRLCAAANEEGTIQATEIQRILPGTNPRNHRTMSLAEAVRLLHPDATLID